MTQEELNKTLVEAVGLIAREVFGRDADRYDEPKHGIQGSDIGNVLLRLEAAVG